MIRTLLLSLLIVSVALAADDPLSGQKFVIVDYKYNSMVHPNGTVVAIIRRVVLKDPNQGLIGATHFIYGKTPSDSNIAIQGSE
jgi:hypothetical protein